MEVEVMREKENRFNGNKRGERAVLLGSGGEMRGCI